MVAAGKLPAEYAQVLQQRKAEVIEVVKRARYVNLYDLLQTKTGEEGFEKHLQSEYSQENLAFWQGARDINDRSIGIEIVNPGHSCGYRPFPAVQMDAVTALCIDIVVRHGIDPRAVLGHSDVAPQRKRDPGELFDWAALAAAGLGLWPRHGFDPEAAAAHAPAMAPGMAGPAVLDLQFALDGIGYEVEGNGLYDPSLAAVVTAFQRHFRPALCDGTADPETLGLVYEILAVAQGPRPPMPAGPRDLTGTAGGA